MTTKLLYATLTSDTRKLLGATVGKILGAILGSKPNKQSVPPPAAAPVGDTNKDKKKAKRARVALTSTSGGISGQELLQGQVGGSDNLFGN